ncbi:TrbC/VirB2 family protein [Sphingomonas sp. CGMCC 1.13654]|uniref:TrbC/VirB2 family protein n=1 Tax=Sphingomonas chungangi TaxID=2683589 RepID=A0A838L2F6_9SPHN|nr:TrbC/VirB2 family protein [Sphingomonas chungangi]MBA2932599.1 TrbC/VirB2 family protein [Sphingomonas chungangi]MVW56222.1 hypothetical protein [Sphingomonas chungangi]
MAYLSPNIAGGSISEASGWIAHLLFGALGVAIAVLAVALLGFRMLLGYSSPREMGRILLGCFILLGTPAIVRALTGEARDRVPTSTYASDISVTPPPRVLQQMPLAPTNPFDPYAAEHSNQ